KGKTGGRSMIKKENLIFIEEALKFPKVVEVVESVGESIWHKVPDVTSFEHTCYVTIGKELTERVVESVEGLASHVANRAAARHVNRSRYEQPSLFSELESEVREESEEMVFEPEDVLADVESEVIQKEMTALMAQGDQRKMMILDYWTIGNRNNAHISRSLARTIGGNAEAHRKAIDRFRKDCRKLFTAV